MVKGSLVRAVQRSKLTEEVCVALSIAYIMIILAYTISIHYIMHLHIALTLV
jgi:hypothetical protein